ncbi:MAG: hypothetical protein AB1657_02085 [Candidatus Micrarchaeota archaeon]
MAIQNIQSLLSRKDYFLLFAATSILSFIALYFLTLATTTGYSLGIFIMMNGLGYAYLTIIMFAAISLLLGLYASLLAHRLKNSCSTDLGQNAPGFAGLASGILGAGCPMCGSLIFGLFGMPLALFFLPYQGLELRALSIIFLSASVFLLSRDMNACVK